MRSAQRLRSGHLGAQRIVRGRRGRPVARDPDHPSRTVRTRPLARRGAVIGAGQVGGARSTLAARQAGWRRRGVDVGSPSPTDALLFAAHGVELASWRDALSASDRHMDARHRRRDRRSGVVERSARGLHAGTDIVGERNLRVNRLPHRHAQQTRRRAAVGPLHAASGRACRAGRCFLDSRRSAPGYRCSPRFVTDRRRRTIQASKASCRGSARSLLRRQRAVQRAGAARTPPASPNRTRAMTSAAMTSGSCHSGRQTGLPLGGRHRHRGGRAWTSRGRSTKPSTRRCRV